MNRPPAKEDALPEVGTLAPAPAGEPTSALEGQARRPPAPAGPAVLGYATLPRGERPDGPELSAQARAIKQLCARRGWRLVELVWDHEPADGRGRRRAGLSRALSRIAAGEASGLVVSSLDRLSRSPSELGSLIDWFSRSEARLGAADLGLDTASPEGRLSTRTLVAVGRLDREQRGEPRPRERVAGKGRRALGRLPTRGARALGEQNAPLGARTTRLLAAAGSLGAKAALALRGRLARGTAGRQAPRKPMAAFWARGSRLLAAAANHEAEAVSTLRGRLARGAWRPALRERTAGIRAQGTKLPAASKILSADAVSTLQGRLARDRRRAVGVLAAGAVVTAGAAGFLTGHTGGGAAPSRRPAATEGVRLRHNQQLERAASAIRRLSTLRVDARARLGRARTAQAQARAAVEAARAHGAAARVLASPPTEPLAAELRRSQRSYLALADAARRDVQSAYGQARSAINRADARLERTVAASRLP